MSVICVSDMELDRIIQELIDGWDTEDMIALLGECEFVLSNNEGRLDQLKVKGLTRLWRVVTGINRKNRQIVLENVQEIQKISLRIQKKLMKRIDLVSSALISLNNKVDQEIFWTQEIINSLIEKLEELPDMKIMILLQRWQSDVRNHVMRDGRKYIDASDGMKIMLVVSDLFKIVHERIYLIDQPFMETTLKEKLNLHDHIKVFDFYKDIICEKEGVFLYTKFNNGVMREDLSVYGQMINKIDGFYTDSYLIEIAENKNISLKDMCMEYVESKIHKNNDIVCSVDLCLELLNDLVSSIPQKANESVYVDKPVNKDKERIHIADDCREYSILRLTPKTDLWLFKNGESKHEIIEPYEKDECIFANEEKIREYLEKNPSLVVAPGEYLRELKRKDWLKDHMNYISLADYYMYLWFCANEGTRKGKILEFIEYYRKDYNISVYIVEDSGDGYRKGSLITSRHHNRTGPHLKKDYNESLKFTLNLLSDDKLVYHTFTSDKDIRKNRLRDSQSLFINNEWEKILKVGNDELGRIINDMVARSPWTDVRIRTDGRKDQ